MLPAHATASCRSKRSYYKVMMMLIALLTSNHGSLLVAPLMAKSNQALEFPYGQQPASLQPTDQHVTILNKCRRNAGNLALDAEAMGTERTVRECTSQVQLLFELTSYTRAATLLLSV